MHGALYCQHEMIFFNKALEALEGRGRGMPHMEPYRKLRYVSLDVLTQFLYTPLTHSLEYPLNFPSFISIILLAIQKNSPLI